MTSTTPTDAFSKVIEEAVHSGVRRALNLSEVTNRRLFSIIEAAKYLGVCRRSLQEMLASGELPSVPHGRRRMLDIQDLDSWIERKKQNG